MEKGIGGDQGEKGTVKVLIKELVNNNGIHVWDTYSVWVFKCYYKELAGPVHFYLNLHPDK